MRGIPRPVVCAAVLSAALLAARFFPLAPLVDVASGAAPGDLALRFPTGHLLTTPFAALADLLTFNSARQWWAWGAWLLAGYGLFAPRTRRSLLIGYPAYLAALFLFLAWAILSGRPAARLALGDPDLLALDFHSHTARSWDGRSSFTPEENAAWHRDAGFSAGFITDHNRIDGAQDLRAAWYRSPDAVYRPLMGEEVSLHDAHIAVLGVRERIDNTLYNADSDGIRRFLEENRRGKRRPAILSLPEYWKHQWDRLDDLVAWGAAGVEIVNASPKALDLPRGKLDHILALCRREGLFVTGISDNHGWGRASYVWNVMRLPGHAAMDPDRLERAVLEALARDGFGAVRVIARAKRAPAAGAMIALDPPLAVWTMLRAFSGLQACALLGWAWGLAGAAALLRRRTAR